jgi:hypothetical protein
MRNYISILLFLIIPFLSFSQSGKVKKMLKEIQNEWSVDDNGNMTYVQVVEANHLSADKIYSNVRDYFVYNYGSGKSVIQTDDKEAGRVVGKGLWKEVHVGLSLVTTYTDCWHILRVDVQEGRARIMLTLTEYNQKIVGGNPPTTTFKQFKVNNSFPCKPKGGMKTVMGKAFYKSHKLALSTISALEKSIKEGNTSKELENDGW